MVMLALGSSCKYRLPLAERSDCTVKVTQSCKLFVTPHGLYSPWNSPGHNTGVSSLSLLQGIFPTQGSNPGLLHWRQILHCLSHQGSPTSHLVICQIQCLLPSRFLQDQTSPPSLPLTPSYISPSSPLTTSTAVILPILPTPCLLFCQINLPKLISYHLTHTL